jgi:PncC family amidohydrolase
MDGAWKKLIETSGAVRGLLEARDQQLVLAESCTAGLISAALAHWPGISNWLCGSAAVYQSRTKHQWLGIDEAILEDPNLGPVSLSVTEKLAVAVLMRTPQATIAAAVTGHLGPGAPAELDGSAFFALAIASKELNKNTNLIDRHVRLVRSDRFQLAGDWNKVDSSSSENVIALRHQRMIEAATQVLRQIQLELR